MNEPGGEGQGSALNWPLDKFLHLTGTPAASQAPQPGVQWGQSCGCLARLHVEEALCVTPPPQPSLSRLQDHTRGTEGLGIFTGFPERTPTPKGGEEEKNLLF